MPKVLNVWDRFLSTTRAIGWRDRGHKHTRPKNLRLALVLPVLNERADQRDVRGPAVPLKPSVKLSRLFQTTNGAIIVTSSKRLRQIAKRGGTR